MNAYRYECRIKKKKEEWFAFAVAILVVLFMVYNLYLYTEDTNIFKVLVSLINPFMEYK